MNWLGVLKAMCPKGKPAILQATAAALPGVLSEYDISTTDRQAHFIAQLAHECAGFKTTVEYASGAAYEGRADLGNTQPGDGKRFKGRGLIQLTGRSNYATASKAMGYNFIADPEAAGRFPHALRVAGWYWHTRKLNALADADDIRAITKKINGGLNGFEDRKLYLSRAREAMAKDDAGELKEVKPKTMATSKTGNVSIGVGTAGGVIAYKEVRGAVTEVKEAVAEAKEASGSAKEVASSLGVSIGVLIGIALIGAAIFLWWDRWRKMKEFGI